MFTSLHYLIEYLDNSAIKVVEGVVAETSALLEQKWDKIFYTGNGRVARVVMAAAAKHLTIAPIIVLDAPEDSLIMNEEIFGPILPIVTVEKVKDGIDFINSRSKPLAAYVFTNKKELKEEFVSTISAGGVVINDVTLHLMVDTLPFGGIGESGTGAYHGKFSFDAFSHKKAVLYRSFMGDAPARYPPYTPGKLRLLKALLDGSVFGIIRALFGFS